MNVNQKGIVSIILIIVVVAIVAIGGYFVVVNKPEPKVQQSTNNQSTKTFLVSLEHVPLNFELPEGYGIYHTESFEGGYVARISVGKEIRHGYLKQAPLTIEFLPNPFGDDQKPYQPSEYVDVLFAQQKGDEASHPQYTQLFGNKAVQYLLVADGSPVIVGYLRANQVLQDLGGHEYLVKISGQSYGTGLEFNKDLFDTVVNSLKVRSN